MRDESKIEEFRSTLAVDGYHLSVADEPERVVVTITADPETCGDCLAPKPILLSMLAPALDVPPERIDLRYPADQAK